eukprot:Nk52_evm15s2568 gene=Nk52_evmTU15s2568
MSTPVDMALQEMEALSDLLTKMISICQKKCIQPHYKDGELAKGESVCLDRCVAKYLAIHDIVGKNMQQIQQEQQNQMQ